MGLFDYFNDGSSIDSAPAGWGDNVSNDFYSSALSPSGWSDGLGFSSSAYSPAYGGYEYNMSAPENWLPLEENSFDDGSMMAAMRGAPDSRGFMDTLKGWDKEYLQPAGQFLQSPGGSLLGGLGMGALSYFDRASANKSQTKANKKMLAQRQAVLDQMNARAAKYDAPIMGATNERGPAASEWGVGSNAFANNSLGAIKPGSAPGYLSGFAEGGSVNGRWVESDRIDPNTRLPEMVWGEDEAPAPKPQPKQEKKLSPLERLGSMFGVTSAIKKGQRDREFAEGGYADGGTPGQSDQIPAMLSDGEFVIDAATVADLGDGNNAAGASALERMRQNVRKHKRSAPTNKIPPKAKKPEQYMKGKK